MNIEDYLETKLPLYSNLKKHFDKIPELKPILIDYMTKGDEKEKTKEKLLSSGVYDDEDILEFLLLISEKQRNFEDMPKDASSEELGRYFFDKYSNHEEKWNATIFRFQLNNGHSYQKEREKRIEETALVMIARSRASETKVIDNLPQEISGLIKYIDEYFQEAFYLTFGREAPISLVDVTRVTGGDEEHADNISGKTYISGRYFYKDQADFFHLVIHEGLHLCFEGLYEKFVEEGLIEFFYEKMDQTFPEPKFEYVRASETYSRFRENLKSLFQALPEAESHFTHYFLTQDIDHLKRYIKEHLTEEKIDEIEEKHYSRGLRDCMNRVRRITED